MREAQQTASMQSIMKLWISKVHTKENLTTHLTDFSSKIVASSTLNPQITGIAVDSG
jgi:hypothetical protein